jgi:hypothetical protein
MAFVRRETRTAGSGSPAQQRSPLRGLPLAAVGRAKGSLRPARDVVDVTVLQPPISYNGLRHADQ